MATATVQSLLQNEFTKGTKAKFLSLCLAEFTDPAPEFLAPFSPTVVPCSATTKPDAKRPPYPTYQGEPAKTAMIGVPKLVSATEATVGVIFWHSLGYVTGAKFYLELRDGVWVVVRREGTFQS